MVIKQRKRQNREVVEYTKEEIAALDTLIMIVLIVSVIAAIASSIVSMNSLEEIYESRTATSLIYTTAGAIIVLWILQPIIKLILRHAPFSMPCIKRLMMKIGNTLGEWFDNSSYFKALGGLTLAGVINISNIICKNLLVDLEGKAGLYYMLAVGLITFAVEAVWFLGGSKGQCKEDIIVITDEKD